MKSHTHRKRKNLTTIIAIIVAVVLVGWLIWAVKANRPAANPYNASQVEQLAECISQKGMQMYGASWCPHCKAQKALFGSAFAKVNYVECTTDTVKCSIAGVQGYPTWIYQGQKYEGEQTLDQLATLTGCPYSGATSESATQGAFSAAQ